LEPKQPNELFLDLKEKVLKVYNLDEVSVIESNTNKDEALSALEVLGFARKAAEKVIDKIIRETPNASVENLIKQALKNL
jgi:Holliday junction DNA helicase RuvA